MMMTGSVDLTREIVLASVASSPTLVSVETSDKVFLFIFFFLDE